jgi:hypothetical protein
MATETTTLTSICSGGNHLTFTLTGAKAATVVLDLSELTGAITDDDISTFCKVIARLCRSDKTLAQARTALQAGITVTA